MLEGPHVDMKDLAIHVFGDVAIATFNGHFTAMIGDKRDERDQQSTMVFVRHAGDWKIVHEHSSPIVAR